MSNDKKTVIELTVERNYRKAVISRIDNLFSVEITDFGAKELSRQYDNELQAVSAVDWYLTPIGKEGWLTTHLSEWLNGNTYYSRDLQNEYNVSFMFLGDANRAEYESKG